MDRRTGLRLRELCLRLLATGCTLAAALIMFFDKQTSNFGGFQVHASYKSSPAFEFFVYGNFAAFAWCLFSLLFVFCWSLKPSFLHMVDQMVLCVVMAACSAATAIAYVGKKGNDSIGWPKVCQYYENFCHTAGISLALSYAAVLFLFILCLPTSKHCSC